MTKKDSNNQVNLDKSQLSAKLKEAVTQLRSLRLKVWQQDLKDVRSIRQIRKEIARFKTALVQGANKK
ncbi:MAG: 50S ribosomal protein L29 [Patescibacteria group bacterium]